MRPGRTVLAASATFAVVFLTAVLVLHMLGQPTPLGP